MTARRFPCPWNTDRHVRIGIVGGGINGLCCAWVLAQAGHEVDLYERNTLSSQTSRASSKLLHGGLRYLEQYEFRLVREALKERDAWLQRVPELTSPLRLVLPIYQGSQRHRWLVGAGLFLYDHLAGIKYSSTCSVVNDRNLVTARPAIKSSGFVGWLCFFGRTNGRSSPCAMGS